MGTYYRINANCTEVAPELLQHNVEQILEEYESTFSLWRENSEISKLNAGEKHTAQSISALFAKNLDTALSVASATNMSFNPLLGLVTTNKGFSKKSNTYKDKSQAYLKQQAVLNNLVYDSEQQSITIMGDLWLDLSGSVKGDAAQQIVEHILQHAEECTRIVVDIGGDISWYADGDSNIKLAVSVPSVNHNQVLFILNLPLSATQRAGTLATSGNYLQFQLLDDTQTIQTHIEQTNKLPLIHVSATAIAKDGAIADAYATATVANFGIVKTSNHTHQVDTFYIQQIADGVFALNTNNQKFFLQNN